MIKLSSKMAYLISNIKKHQLINFPSWKGYLSDLRILIFLVIWLALLAWLILFVRVELNDLLKKEEGLIDFIRDKSFFGLIGKAGWKNLVCLVVFLLLSAFFGVTIGVTIRQVLKNNVSNIFLYIVFAGLLFSIVLVTWHSLPDQQEKITLAQVLQRITLVLPLVWLASHVNAIINKRARIYLELEHKEGVMTFYSAFKEEIEDPDLKNAFYQGVVDVILRFPSVIGEAQETDSPLEKIFGRKREKKVKKSIDDNITRKAFDKAVDE